MKVIDLLLLLKHMARAMYFPMKLLPTAHKVVLISRKNTKTSIDFQMLHDRLKQLDPSIEVVILNHKMKSKFRHIFAVIQEMYHLATAKSCIIDSYIISVSILNHKKSLVVVQLWHALGALKKFGHLAINKKDGSSKKMATVMEMHRNYSYVCSGSEAMADVFAKAFNVERHKVKPVGMPRVDYLLNTGTQSANRKQILEAYPELRGRQVILYAPTFRKRSVINPKELIDEADKNKFSLVIKQHPLDKTTIAKQDGVIVDEEFDFLQWLSVADHMVTDYSAGSFEAALLGIPLYFWVYDKEAYKKRLGLTVSSKELPGIVSTDAAKIMNSIKQKDYDHDKLKLFQQKYAPVPSETCTDAIIELTGVLSQRAFVQKTAS